MSREDDAASSLQNRFSLVYGSQERTRVDARETLSFWERSITVVPSGTATEVALPMTLCSPMLGPNPIGIALVTMYEVF